MTSEIQFASQLVINPSKVQTYSESLVWSLFKTRWRQVKREANHITLWGPSGLELSGDPVQLWKTSIRCSLTWWGEVKRWPILTNATPTHFSYRMARHKPAISVYERMLGSTEGHNGLKQTRRIWYSSTKHIHWKNGRTMTKEWQLMHWITVKFWCKKLK